MRLLDVGEGRRVLVIRVTEGRKAKETYYHLTKLATDFGRGFRLHKSDFDGGEVYHVNLDGPRSTCECKGWLRWGHCKHRDAMQELVNLGRV